MHGVKWNRAMRSRVQWHKDILFGQKQARATILDVNGGPKHARGALLSDRGIRSMPEQPFERSERSGACSSSHFERTCGFEHTFEQSFWTLMADRNIGAAILSDLGIRSMPEQPFAGSERFGVCSSSHLERTSCFEREYGVFGHVATKL